MYEGTDRMRDRDASPPEAASGQTDGGQKDVERAGRGPATPSSPEGGAPFFDKVDDASDDSFPASDAPAWTGTHAGSPRGV